MTCAAKKSSVVLILTDGVTRVLIYELLFACLHMNICIAHHIVERRAVLAN
jgi:hypothetical protein